MKTLLLMLMIFVSSIIAQDAGENLKYYDVGNGFFIVDSLYQDYPGISTSDSVDTIDEIELGFGFSWVTITAIDTGTTYTDSCIVEYSMPNFQQSTSRGALNYTQTGKIWQRVQFMRDSSWTNTNLIPDNSSVKSYMVFVGGNDRIRLRMLNAQIRAGRVWKYRLSATKEE